MNRFTGAAVVAAACLAIASTAQAGDFNGTYVGVFGRDNFGGPSMGDLGFGAYAGYNGGISGMMLGVEASVDYDNNPVWAGSASALTTQVDARVGAQATEDLLLFAKAGMGYTTGGSGSFVWDAGLGGDYMISDGISVRGELDRVDPTSAGMETRYDLRLGVGYHF